MVAAKVADLYRSLDTEIMTMGCESAELVKYASNGILAARLSYINAIATLCELVGANVTDVVRGMGVDQRISPLFLEEGPGWGGSCFPKDTDALVSMAEDAGFDFALLREAVESNQAHILDLAEAARNGFTYAATGRPTLAPAALAPAAGSPERTPS